MAYLFKIEGKAVFPTTEILLVNPFKEIWARDKTKGKSEAMEDFAYIEFMTSMLKSNPYKGYSTEVKEKVIIADVITRKDWKPDQLILEGMEYIFKQQKEGSASYTLYLSTLQAKEKLESMFRTIDLNERNFKTGMPVYKPKELSTAMLDVDKITTALSTLEKKVEEELFDSVRTKGAKEISPFADPNSLVKF